MNGVQSATVETTFEHSLCANNMQKFVIKKCRNELDVERNIINVITNFETIRITHR